VRTSEQRRLYDEYERIWDGQYNFADDATREQLRPRLISELEKAIVRHPRNVLNYWALGDLYEKTDDWDKTAAVYEGGMQAVKTRRARLYLEYNVARARYRQGVALEKEQKWDEALALYEALLQAHPEAYYSRLCLNREIVIWSRREKEPEKAVEACRRYLALYPDSDSCPDILLDIAQAYGRQANDGKATEAQRSAAAEKAIETYRSYIATYPNRSGCERARMAIVSIYRNRKDNDSAIRECEEIVAKYPRSSIAPEALRTLFEIYARLAAPGRPPPSSRRRWRRCASVC